MARFEVISEPTAPESGLGQLARHGAATAATIGETVGNLPSNIVGALKGAGNLATSAVDYLVPQQAKNILNLGKEPLEPLSKTLQRFPQMPEIPQFGTKAKELVSKALPEGYLEPQSESGKKYHEFVSDVTSLMLPLGPAMKLGRAAAVAGSGALAKWAAQNVGAGELGQTGAKMGAMLASSLIGPTGLRNYMTNLYNEADALVPETATISTQKIEPVLSEINKILSEGGTTRSKNFVSNKVAEIESKIAERATDIASKITEGKMPVRDALEFKRNVHEWIDELGGMGKLKGIEKKLPKLGYALKESIKDYGAKDNTPFIKLWSEAEDIFQGMQPTLGVNKFLQKHVNKENIGKITGGVLLGYIPPATGSKLIGTGLGVREGVKFYDMMKRSPAIRNHYGRVIKAAAKENSKALAKEVAALDKQISKEFPENVSGSGEETGRYLLLD